MIKRGPTDADRASSGISAAERVVRGPHRPSLIESWGVPVEAHIPTAAFPVTERLPHQVLASMSFAGA